MMEDPDDKDLNLSFPVLFMYHVNAAGRGSLIHKDTPKGAEQKSRPGDAQGHIR